MLKCLIYYGKLLYMEEQRLKQNIARNLIACRKKCNLTQAQLAEKIAYSDKAVSKWERGEAIPDTFVLCQLAEVFNVTLNDLIADEIKITKKPYFVRNRIIITTLSCLIAWFIAMIIFVIGCIADPSNGYYWLSFVYALVVNFIILIVFADIWGKRWMRFVSISGLIWSLCLGVFLPLYLFGNDTKTWMVFLIGIPVQIAFIFWFLLKKRSKNL